MLNKFLGIIFSFAITLPIFAVARERGEPIVPDCSPNCHFADFINLGQNIIDFLLYDFAVPFAVILVAWGGFLYLGQAASDNTSKAKQIFYDVVIGFFIAAGAFLIIKLILTTLGAGDASKIFLNL